ncbi:Trehalase [Eumeta japonica]|uniref:Trehalase n=1 Tax=Eumeta variegata TaxID=151549 RepID=A0A4C1VLG3_EUMVA|nr:Trehalase [Eumeta japonica]
MMRWLVLIACCACVAGGSQLPPSCDRPIFCNSDILHEIQLARFFPDSKTFVDMHLRHDVNTTFRNFRELQTRTDGKPSRDELKVFLDEHFEKSNELEEWVPSDYDPEPKFLDEIYDPELKQFGKDVHSIWLKLGRKMKQEVFDQPERYSLIPITHGFMIPGGRFTEIYYWDTYWIIEGLLVSGMTDTARGIIENFIELLNTIGLVPNGSRWYYQQRSQPPLLTAMVDLYMRQTKDYDFLSANVRYLEKELEYWLDTQTVSFKMNGKTYTMLHYNAPSSGPRPESYYEDYNNALYFDSSERRQEFYTDLKSAAASGWDFSSRWFIDSDGNNSGNITAIHTRYIIPVDLNSIFASAVQTIASFHAQLGNWRAGAQWAYIAKQWRIAIEEVLWDEDDGIWYDYDMKNEKMRRYFFPTNLSPLWLDAVDADKVLLHGPRVLGYVRGSAGFQFPGGVPSSLDRTGEQWDFPNAWPPLVGMAVNAIEATGLPEGRDVAHELAQTWVRANLLGFKTNKQMFEKYDAEHPGQVGGGGEYTVQEGFGWSNGIVLEFLSKYGRTMTAGDATDASSIDSGDKSDTTEPTGSKDDSDSADSSSSSESSDSADLSASSSE